MNRFFCPDMKSSFLRQRLLPAAAFLFLTLAVGMSCGFQPTQETPWEQYMKAGETALQEDDLAKARDAFALAVSEAGKPDRPPELLAKARIGLGRIEARKGNYANAEQAFLQALSAFESAGDHQTDTARVLDLLGDLYRAESRYEEAIPLYQRSAHLKESHLGGSSPELMNSLYRLARLYIDLERDEAAVPLLKRALEISQRQKEIGERTLPIIRTLADVYRRQGSYSEAEPLLRTAIKSREKRVDEYYETIAGDLRQLGELMVRQGKLAEAEPVFRQALELDEKYIGPENLQLSMDLRLLGDLYIRQGRERRAQPLLERSLAIREALLGETHPDVAEVTYLLARLHHMGKDYEAARPYYYRTLSILDTAVGQRHPDLERVIHNLAEFHRERNAPDDAELLYMRLLTLNEAREKPDPRRLASVHTGLARLYAAKGDYRRAERYYNQALTVYGNPAGDSEHPLTARILKDLADIYEKTGRIDEASGLRLRAREIRLRTFI